MRRHRNSIIYLHFRVIYVNPLYKGLEEALRIAEEVKNIPNLPEYIDQPHHALSERLGYTCKGLLNYVDRIRQRIPDGAIEAERKIASYGSQQSLV